MAVTALSEGRGNRIIATQDGYIVEIPIEEAMSMKKHLQQDRYRIMQTMQLGSLKDPIPFD